MNDNKFKVGDEVVYKESYKAEVFGVANKEDVYNEYYAISYTTDGSFWFNTVDSEGALSELKKKDELEVGDKFKCKTATGKTNRINEVLAVAEDEKYNQIIYLAKRITGEWTGYVDVYTAEAIEEIIYE
jgi:hypothetical protein